MELKINEIYHGFKLVEKKKIEEIDSTMNLFVHEKTGAQLMKLQNEDNDKVFSIAFRTPPYNSTGLPHILEHSVLCGSKKFPTKEPFVELVKGSLNTFLNAMTFPDKTMYPVASKNNKDFFNLMDVYLDAVFNPKIYDVPEIFMQEGWHYELENKEDEITYKGVVFNEMKGAFSAPESILMRKIQETLFPDTSYGVESGGDPEVIPQLTEKEFLDFHKKYYHPSNSYIYLYGDGDLMEELKFIEENYLVGYEKIEIDSSIKMQKPFEKINEVTMEYPISSQENEKDKTYLSMNFVVGTSLDPQTYLTLEILDYMLLSSPAAPLKNALIKAGIGKDVFGSGDNGVLQPMFSIVLKNSNEDKKEKFINVIYDTLKDLVANGIDKKLVEAAVNRREFKLREADYQGLPKGLFYNIKAMDSWLYDENPTMHLEYEETLNNIKAALDDNYFEKFIEQYLLNNTHGSVLILVPKKGLAEEKAEEVRVKLQEYKESLNDSQIQELIQQTAKLKERQITPDSQEVLETIPLLSLEDINPKADELPLVEKEIEGVKILDHSIFTSGISYINLLFDASVIEEEMIPYLGILAGVLGKVNTERYSYSQLSNEVNINTGGIYYSVESYAQKDSSTVYYPKFMVRAKALMTKLPELMDLIREIILKSNFEDKDRLKEIIRELKSRTEMGLFNSGHIVAINRLYSYFSPAGSFVESAAGLKYYKVLEDLEKNFDDRVEEIISKLKLVSEKIFNKKDLLVSVTCDEADYEKFTKDFNGLLAHLPEKDIAKESYEFKECKCNEGLITPGKVQYVAKGYNFRKNGYEYSGKLQVLKTIIGMDYLWNKIRVQGGAYGSFANFSRTGNMFFASYRDPNLKQTIDSYDGAAGYLREFNADDREMTKYIIGTISKLDSPLTPSMIGLRATSNYISKLTQEDIQKEREEVLNTTEDDIKKYATLIEDCMKENYLCVFGGESTINQNKDIFKNLINVFE